MQFNQPTKQINQSINGIDPISPWYNIHESGDIFLEYDNLRMGVLTIQIPCIKYGLHGAVSSRRRPKNKVKILLLRWQMSFMREKKSKANTCTFVSRSPIHRCSAASQSLRPVSENKKQKTNQKKFTKKIKFHRSTRPFRNPQGSPM